MIFIDFNQTAIANFLMYKKTGKLGMASDMLKDEGITGNFEEKTDLELMRHFLLLAILSYKRRFSHEYGLPIICCDSKNLWRRAVFPFYKAKRKQHRENSDINWPKVHENLDILKKEFFKNVPYALIEVEGAEGDDVIAILCKYFYNKNPHQKSLIYSSDTDFLQLQKYPSVSQYDKYKDRLITPSPQTVEQVLQEHIIRGDVDDGIPNILSADNCFMVGQRQSPIMSKKCDIWINQNPKEFCIDDTMFSRYQRNQRLIDFSFIPKDIEHAIIEKYESMKIASGSLLYSYLINTKAKEIFQSIGDFKS